MSFGGPFLLAPLSSMLGIRAGMNVGLHHPPPGFLEALLPLPEGATLVPDAKTGLDLQVLFASRKTEAIEGMRSAVRGMAVTGAVWVAFPTRTDLPHAPSEDFVRLAGLEMGLHDVKLLMLDSSWMALKFQQKPRSPRPERPSATA